MRGEDDGSGVDGENWVEVIPMWADNDGWYWQESDHGGDVPDWLDAPDPCGVALRKAA